MTTLVLGHSKVLVCHRIPVTINTLDGEEEEGVRFYVGPTKG